MIDVGDSMLQVYQGTLYNLGDGVVSGMGLRVRSYQRWNNTGK